MNLRMRFLASGLSLALFTCVILIACRDDEAHKGWPVYHGSKGNLHYSSLTQVDTHNVRELAVAWTYRTGDADTAHKSQIQCNPIMVDGILYGTTPQMKLFALDVETGKEKWVFNPFSTLDSNRRMFFVLNNSRGVAYWREGDDQRVLYTAGPNLYCINAATGQLILTFGDSGKVDLHKGLGRNVDDLFITATSPGVVYQDLIIMGSRVDEGPAAAPGHIRAYDVRTGQQRWIFHTIPHPGEFGYDTWDDTAAYRFIGGANAWSGLSLDEKRGIVFAGTGSASYDFYGGRRTGNNLFADCVLALDAATGKRVWHFQHIHHDVWDHDLPTPPVLVTVRKNGSKIDAVAQVTKTGFVFLFERETGRPIFPIEERPVPTQSELVGEKLAPTQPYPTAPEPFVRQIMTEADLNDLLPDTSYQTIRKQFLSYRSGNMFEPISKAGTIVFPGLDGGGEWGGPAFDPETGLLYVNANEMAWVLTAIDVKSEVPAKETYLDAGRRLYTAHCTSCHGPDLKGSGNFPSIVTASSRYKTNEFYQLLGSGRRMMPAFKQLNNEEQEAIASYVLNVKTSHRKEFKSQKTSSQDSYRKLPYTITGYNKFLSPEGYPAIKPPWGTLNAIDLSTGKIVWKEVLGDYPEFKARGIRTGTENYGGPVVTKGGLVFIAATRDSMFRAFNKVSGELIWETKLPAAAFATPSIFEWKERQYVIVACGGGKLGTISSDAYVAFRLPE